MRFMSTSTGDALLVALQHGDSFFPSGTIPFSWGLETLAAEHAVTSAADVRRLVEGQLTCRWATCDRPALVGAYRAADALDEVASVDNQLDALALSREMRQGGRRAGGALLSVHVSLATPRAADYRDLVRAGDAPGQLAVVQGLVWRSVGLNEQAASALSGYTTCVGFVGAAMRLGLIGHVDGQGLLSETRSLLSQLLAEPPPPFDEVSAYTPAAEIAMMRHEVGQVRMFAN
jgi:urease accessory protein